MLLKRLARKTRGKKTDAGASAADGGRLRFDYLVDDVNKPNMIKNQLPRSRWSNRAFPPNHADLDPHPHTRLGRAIDVKSNGMDAPAFNGISCAKVEVSSNYLNQA